MRISKRVRVLEEAIRPRACRVCGDRSIGLVYDPTHPDGKPMTMGGVACPEVPCAACGRWPRIVLSMPPPKAEGGARA